MADIFDDMMDTVGAVPPDASDRPAQPPPRVPPSAGMRTKEVPTNDVSMAQAKAEAEALFKMMGTSLQEEDMAFQLEKRKELVAQVYKDAEKNAPFLEKVARTIDKMDNNVVTRNTKSTVAAPIEVAAGVALGASNAFNSGVNAFKEGYNALGKIAKDHGLVDSFEPTALIDFSKFQDENYPETTKVIANIGQSLTPAVAAAATMAASGPVAGVVAAGAASYMLLDPKAAGLAELFKDTAIGKTLMLDEAFRYSEKKPEDTEIEGRLKNVLDYTFGESLIGGAIAGIRGMYNGGKRLLPFLKATDEAAQVVEAAPKAVEGIPVVQQVDNAPVPKAAPAMDNPPPVEFEQFTLEDWAANIGKDAPVQGVSAEDLLKVDPTLSSKRGAQTLPGMIAEGQKRQQTPGWFRELLDSRKQDPTRPLAAEDSLALDLEGVQAQLRAEALASKALATNSPLDVIAAQEALDYQVKVLSVKEAVSSEAGRTLGITEGLARAVQAGTDEESVKIGLDILGSKGRAKLMQQYMDAYGGVRSIQERLKMVELLREIPNQQFADETIKNMNTMKKVVRQTGWRKFTDAAYSVWTSSVLTVKTVGNVYVLNQAATAMQAADNYTATLIGAIPKFGGKSSITEANAFASGIIESQWKAHKVGIESLIKGHQPTGYTVNGDFSRIASDADTAGANSVWGWLYQKGMAAATSTGRLVMSADVVSKYVNEHAFVKAQAAVEAMQMAERLGVPSSQRTAYISKYIDDVLDNPTQQMIQNARDMGEKLTQSRSITDVPVLGKISEALEEDPTGLARFLMPFFRTGVNTTLNALEYVPVMNLALKNTRDALLAGGKARDQVVAKMVNGSLFSYGVYSLFDAGYLHGEMPNFKQQQALADGGKGVTPFTLDLTELGLGAHYIRPLDPIGKVLRMASVYSAVAHGNQDLETSDYIHTLGAVAFSQVTPESMQTVNALVEAINGRDTKAITNLLQTTLANTVVPLRGTIKQISNAAQGLYAEDMKFEQRTVKSDEDEFMGMFRAQLADTIGYGLPPKRDIFGEPIKAHWLTALSPWPTIDTENSEVGKKLRVLSDFEGRLRLAGFEPAYKVEMPAMEVSSAPAGARVKLTANEYDDLLVEMNKPSARMGGMTLKEAVNESLNRHMKDIVEAGQKSYLDNDAKISLYKATINSLDKVFKEYEDGARRKIEASPDVQKRINDAIKKAKPLDMSGYSLFGGN